MSAQHPYMIYRAHGISDDELDRLDLAASFENPGRWEDTVKEAHRAAETDSELSALLKSVYLQADRNEAFSSFFDSGVPDAVGDIISRFGITQESKIADVGCGPGQLGYSLWRKGYKRITVMDPNSEWYTGTGYLRSIAANEIAIINDFPTWRTLDAACDAIVSQATVHHWQHIPLASLDLRRNLKPGGFWFAFSEYFANTPREFLRAIRHHPTASRYGCYEWAYPPSAYVDLIQSVGFNLVAVVPYFYRRNALSGSLRGVPHDVDLAAIDEFVDQKLIADGGTVDQFWTEVDRFRRQAHGNRVYTEPQLLAFQRIEV